MLNESSGFNYNLRVQMFFGAFFSVLLGGIGLAYLISTHRNYTAYLAYEFDPQTDGFTDDDQYKLRGGRFWLRVLGCKRLPKEKREILQELELDAAHGRAVTSAAAHDVDIDFDSGSDSGSGGSSSSSSGYESAASTPSRAGHQYRGVTNGAIQAPSTPPLASAPPLNIPWEAGGRGAHLGSIENDDLPIASPRYGAPPLAFGAEAPRMAPTTPPLMGEDIVEPGTPPMLHEQSHAGAVASTPPLPLATGIPHDEYEDLWDLYPRLGGFKADVSLNPPLAVICEHLQQCSMSLAASGTTTNSSTVFAYVTQRQPGPAKQCLVKLVFDHGNQHLRLTFKGPAGLDVSSVAATLRLAQLFGSIAAS